MSGFVVELSISSATFTSSTSSKSSSSSSSSDLFIFIAALSLSLFVENDESTPLNFGCSIETSSIICNASNAELL